MNEKELLKSQLVDTLMRNYGCSVEEATEIQLYKALCVTVRGMLGEKAADFHERVKKAQAKEVYYLSMEFLVGTSLKNNLYNLGLLDETRELVSEIGFDLDRIIAIEPDAGLGNGGLGRLASCYLDAMTTQEVPCTGYSIRYEFGIFRQKIIDGWQTEQPDNWLKNGSVWLVPRMDETREVKLFGTVEEHWQNGRMTVEHKDYKTILAVPYDMYISGYNSDAVNKLVLWGAQSPQDLDMQLFSQGAYLKAMEQNSMAEAITKILYPADEHYEGKQLRLKQQYLLVSASLQKIIAKHIRHYGTLDNLPEKVAIHINDTHPSLCVPELMRILMDEYGYPWDKAYDITSRTLAYTNHTVMQEALEVWPIELFRTLLPRIFAIVQEINRRFTIEARNYFPGESGRVDAMAIVSGNYVRMANMCTAVCHKVNGVSKLHSDIVRTELFRDFAVINPDKFTNVTNGIAYRRWLCQSNPLLTDLLKECIGDGFLKNAEELKKFEAFRDDASVLQSLQEIKRANKLRLAAYVSKANGMNIDPDSLFDVQVKRLHEYKRQLLNAMHILYLYNELKKNPNMPMQPQTFVFAAKASAGYIMAKQIIRFIYALGDVINNDPEVRGKLRVVFIEDYKVSLAETIIPAADISEQISIAGKEASGTGNMKLMINGAVTLGTLDGANVEILEQVGFENIFIFGLKADEAENLHRSGYNPLDYYRNDAALRETLDSMRHEIGGSDFNDIVNSLIGGGYNQDTYMILADFDSYRKAHQDVLAAYADRQHFSQMSLSNIANAGLFSADRAVMEYCRNIWGAYSLKDRK